MKKIKVAAIALTSIMLFSTTMGVTGCNKKGGSKAVKNTVRTVEEDSIWFNYKEIELKIFEDSSKFDYINLNTNMVKTDEGFVTTVTAYPKNWEVDSSETLILKVFLPNDLDIVKEIAYDKKISSEAKYS